MARKTTKSAGIWLSFDLGVEGDYEGLYEWLDDHAATECGGNVAFFMFVYRTDVIQELRVKLTRAVKLKPQDRIYVIRTGDNGKPNGRFIHGRRRRPPWTGYAPTGTNEVDAG